MPSTDSASTNSDALGDRQALEGRAPFWPRKSPHFLAIRHAVVAAVEDERETVESGDEAAVRTPDLIVGLSGGADSLALTAACCAEYPGHVTAVVVDHQLQEGSAAVAQRAAQQAESLGAKARVIAVDVSESSIREQGMEAAAREARHQALRQFAAETAKAEKQAKVAKPHKQNPIILLGHTLDDQAETVLLRLARGGGTYGLSGIAPKHRWDDGTLVVRPLLQLRRADTEAACQELQLDYWQDPHNSDERYARVRVRNRVLPAVVKQLGEQTITHLAQTAADVREDLDALDEMAEQALRGMGGNGESGSGVPAVALPIATIQNHPAAIRKRIYQRWIRQTVGSELHRAQLEAIDQLVCQYHGQGPVAIPQPQEKRAEKSVVKQEKKHTGLRRGGGRLVVSRKSGTLAVLWM